MSFEVRGITTAEIAAAERIAAHAFGDAERHDPAERIARAQRDVPADCYLASFEDGEMTAMMRTFPLATRLNGGTLDFGAVSPVAASPLHRRKGHTGALLRRSLAVMRERGMVMSGLWTPHPAFYRRYGWEIAGDERRYKFNPKDLLLTASPRERGRLRFTGSEAWQELDAIYNRHSALRNGPLVRSEGWWRVTVLADDWPTRQQHDIVVWEDGQGAAQGYLVYAQPSRPHPAADSVLVRELVALTPDAYLNLLTYIGQFDIFREVRLTLPSEDPLPLLFEDGERLPFEQRYTVLLRIVDVEAALRQRRPAGAALDLELTLRVEDDSAPWNQGTWRVRVAEGTASVERTEAPADLTLSATVLAPLFDNYLRPSRAAACGMLAAKDEDALRRADAYFATLFPPYFPDQY